MNRDQFTQRATNTSTDIDRTVPNRVDHRLLTFKNSQAWLSYNDEFGDPNVYGAMTGHIEHVSGDIALQEILGPMPDLTMHQLVAKAGERAPITQP